MKKLFLALVAVSLFGTKATADEGMWLLPYIGKLNIAEMQAKGLKLSAEDIYSINNSSLKDAIIHFGGGCTGEIISDQGLILTNHHCGYGSIQALSSVENDYLKNGFWAMSQREELPSPGLRITFVDRIEDVSDRILPHLNENMTEDERNAKVAELGAAIVKDLGNLPFGSNAYVRAFLGGNQYLLFVNKVYSDVRLVGAPPTSIGKFGHDTDNWMWPRHTGDFSIFRVYADKDGNPAEYSADNVPLKPKKHLPVSLKGVEEGDFAMIIGFPGSTSRFMSSWEIDEMLEQNNPIRIFVRGERQDILMADMQADPKINLQYASKYSGSSNYWKNSIGMSRGVRRLNVRDQKAEIEAQFNDWVNADPARRAKYGEALRLKEEAVKGRRPYTHSVQYMSEALSRGIELISLANTVSSAREQLAQGNVPENLRSRIDNFYKNYSMPTDLKSAKRMLRIFSDSVPAEKQPEVLVKAKADYNNNFDRYADYLYNNTIFASEQKLNAFLANPDINILDNDPVTLLAKSVTAKTTEYNTAIRPYTEMFNKGHRLFIAGLLEMNADKVYYPDANSTIRLTYGSVLPYEPRDAVTYNFYTTLKGVLEKEDPNNLYEFEVPQKLKDLYNAKDFGDYAYKGDVPVNFITNNDITGGNSGSPVINGNGELIGSAFDGNWEAMSGDIAFEPDVQRSIAVDVRYILFIIDKYAGAQHLIDEMTVVK